jgi:hypothetical protein
MIDSPKILHIGTRVLVFSDKNQVTFRDMTMADVAILIQDDHFLVVKDRYKEPWGKKMPLYLLSGTLNYYYDQIKFRLHDQNI